MPILEGAQDQFLAGYFGANKGATAPASHDVALFTDAPTDGGVEVTGGGYARVTIANDSGWPAPSSGLSSRLVVFPAASGDWTGANCWVLFDGTTMVAFEFLSSTLAVSAGDPGPGVAVTAYIPNADNVGA